jgi:NDP-sugar pyrophosphorylase family protein
MVPALVLTAGLATRLRPLSLVRAKAALPVAGVPLAHRILRGLAAAGVTDAVLNLHHLPHTLTALTGDGTRLGLRVRYSWEVPVLGSAGGPKRAIPLLSGLGTRDSGLGSTFLIVNGDTLTDVDLRAVVSSHLASRALVTVAVVPNTEPDKYGGALVDRDGIITGFAKRGSAEGSFHVIGVQVAEAEAFASVPADTPFESTRALYPSLIASRPGSIRAFHATAEFFDIGTPADYLDTSLRIAEREGHSAGGHAQVDPSARIERSVLWDDVVVEAGAMLKECVVTDGVRIPSDTSWHEVTIRVATDDLAPGERRFDELAIGSL